MSNSSYTNTGLADAPAKVEDAIKNVDILFDSAKGDMSWMYSDENLDKVGEIDQQVKTIEQMQALNRRLAKQRMYTTLGIVGGIGLLIITSVAIAN